MNLIKVVFIGMYLLGTGVIIGWWLAGEVLYASRRNASYASRRLRQGHVEAWNTWRELNPAWSPQLMHARLTGLALQGVDLSRANLSRANLCNADFTDGDLSHAQLTQANLSGACLKGANLDGADLSDARMEGTSLDRASMQGTQFNEDTARTAEDTIAMAGRASPQRETVQNLSIPELLDAVHMNPALLTDMSLEALNAMVAELLGLLGYRVQFSPQGDPCMPFLASREEPLANSTYLVQCKVYQKQLLGAASVMALDVLREREDVTGALLFAANRFTQDAAEFATHLRDVQLINGPKLCQLVEHVLQDRDKA